MQFHLRIKYASLEPFSSPELPNFTLITGLNGSGKSQLLRAIQGGGEAVGLMQPDEHAILYEAAKSQLISLSSYMPGQNVNIVDNIVQSLNSARYDASENLNSLLLVTRLPRNDNSTEEILYKYGEEDFESCQSGSGKALSLDAFNLRERWEHIAKNYLGSSWYDCVAHAERIGKKPILLLREDIIGSPFVGRQSNSYFNINVAQAFGSYRDALLRNRLCRISGEPSALSDKDFIAAYGQPPWDGLNRLLYETDLGVSISTPELYNYDAYVPKFVRESDGAEILASDLSSGEAVIAMLTFSVYQSTVQHPQTVKATVLLLDEVDAVLHPSFCKKFISTIKTVFVERLGLKVIATTHSPSTVALAPDESVYALRPGGPLEHVGRARALNILTAGVPTLAISYSGQRQVFVENAEDGYRFDAICKILKPKLKSERSLSFIGTGLKDSVGGSVHDGCTIVYSLVDRLVSNGNESVFGLVDWDGGKNKTKNRVVVLAENSRYSIENILFDPLIFSTLLCRDYLEKSRKILGMAESETFRDFFNFPQARLQQIVRNFALHIWQGPPISEKRVSYLGGIELEIDERCLLTRGHDYWNIIYERLPMIRAIKGRPLADAVAKHIVDVVLPDVTEFIPIELFDALSELLD